MSRKLLNQKEIKAIAKEHNIPADIFSRITNVVTQLEGDDKVKFTELNESMRIKIGRDPSKKFECNYKILKFIFELEEKQFMNSIAKTWLNLADALGRKFPNFSIERKEQLKIETSLGYLHLIRFEEGFELYISALNLYKEIFEENINFPASELPLLFESFACENLCMIQFEKDGFFLKGLLGSIKLIIESNKCRVRFSSVPILVEFFEKINNAIESDEIINAMLKSNIESEHKSVEMANHMRSIILHMSREEREQLADIMRGENEEVSGSEYLLEIQEKQQINLFAKVWSNLTYRIKTKYSDSFIPGDFPLRLETPIGHLELVRSNDFIELRIFSINLAKEILGADVEFPFSKPPQLLEQIAIHNHNKIKKEGSEFTINGELGDISLNVYENGCNVKIAPYKLRDFFENLNINFQNQ